MQKWRGTVVEGASGMSPDQFLSRTGSPHCMGAAEGGDRGVERQSGVMLAEPKTKTRRPPMYKVILLNDDYTPMDFVVQVLEHIFRHPPETARAVMLEVHQKGAGLAGIYTRDVAETKVDQVIEYARINEYPLQCALESE